MSSDEFNFSRCNFFVNPQRRDWAEKIWKDFFWPSYCTHLRRRKNKFYLYYIYMEIPFFRLQLFSVVAIIGTMVHRVAAFKIHPPHCSAIHRKVTEAHLWCPATICPSQEAVIRTTSGLLETMEAIWCIIHILPGLQASTMLPPGRAWGGCGAVMTTLESSVHLIISCLKICWENNRCELRCRCVVFLGSLAFVQECIFSSHSSYAFQV